MDPAPEWGEWEWRRCDHRQKFYRTKSVSWTDENGWQHGVAYPYCDTCGSVDIDRPMTMIFKGSEKVITLYGSV